MRKVLAVAAKEVKQVRRDPLTLGLLLGVPALMLLLYGYALNFDVRHVALAVEDRSHSRASRELVATFVNSTYFDVTVTLPAPAPSGSGHGAMTYGDVLERRLARAVLVIPESFARDVAAGRSAAVQMILDGADANTATTVLGYATGLVQDTNVRLVSEALGRAGTRFDAPVRYEPRVWYNPELKSTIFLVPGLIGFILMITALLSTALSIVREKERGTMEQLRVSALRPAELVIGKTIPYLVISLAATEIILVASRVLFGVRIAGSWLQLMLATLVYLIGALGLGLLVSSLAKTQAMAFQAGTLLSMLPAIFLSGFIFPLRSMPAVLQAISYAVPARYYLVIARGVMIKGTSLAPFGREMLFLVVFAAVILGISFVRLTRREA